MQYKTYVATLTPETIEWIKKSAKMWKMRPTEFVRVLFDYLQKANLDNLKKDLQKATIEAKLQEAKKQAEQYKQEFEKLESQLEELQIV